MGGFPGTVAVVFGRDWLAPERVMVWLRGSYGIRLSVTVLSEGGSFCESVPTPVHLQIRKSLCISMSV